MPYEQLLTNVDEVRRAARAAVAIYLGSHPTSPNPATHTQESGRASLLDDAKVQALLSAALRNPDLFNQPPEEVHDVAGNLIFRDFVFALEGDAELRIRTGANKALGAAIVSISVAPAWDRTATIEALVKRAAQENLGIARLPVRVVCYEYPRLGIVLDRADHTSVVVDLRDNTIHPTESDPAQQFWTPYLNLSSEAAESAASRFQKEQDALGAWASGATTQVLDEGVVSEAQGHTIPLEWCGQERQAYCAEASSVMILNRWGISKTQEEVANEFAACGPLSLEQLRFGGTPPSIQQQGLDRLVQQKQLAATLWSSTSPDVQDDWDLLLRRIRSELDSDRPIQRQRKSVLHVDVVAGWQPMVGTDDPLLYVYDPGGGPEPYWDRWAPTDLYSLVFVHPPGV